MVLESGDCPELSQQAKCDHKGPCKCRGGRRRIGEGVVMEVTMQREKD